MYITKLIQSLKSSTTSKSIKQGKLIHQKIITLGLQNNIVLSKHLINLYMSCHHYNSAKHVFDNIVNNNNTLDVTLYNSLMSAYAKQSMYSETLEVFERLLKHIYLSPDSYSYPSVLKACGGIGDLRLGKMVHAHLVKNGCVLDVVVASSVVGMYAKGGVFEDAVKVFDEMSDRDVASWNTVISCYYQDGQVDKALEMFDRMRESGFKPDSVTLTTAISSCARLLDLERGKEIHRELVDRGVLLDGFISSALVDMYGKCGSLEMAQKVFEQIPKKSVVAWNSMISGCSLKGDSRLCIEYFTRMIGGGTQPTLTTLSSILMACSRSANLLHGKLMHGFIIRNNIGTDIFIDSSLIDLYFKCGEVQSAQNVFQKTAKTNVVTWNVMISGYVTVGNYFDALNAHDEMRKAGVEPDAITFTSILAACSQLAALQKGIEIHKSIIDNKLKKNEVVMGALLDMYAKCGAVKEALDVFYQLPERDLVSWTSMITAYGSHGYALEALKLFDEMQQSNVKPDRVTFLAILSACSHVGLVDEGCYYFSQMMTKYDIKPRFEHFACLIDLLGRAGRLHDAYAILQKTPEIKEDADLLSTLFSACHLHKEPELGEQIANLLIDKDPDDPSTYVVLSNMYASAKKWDEARRVRLKMKELGLKKNPGCSWIEINKRIHSFFVKDTSHPQSDMIYECLEILAHHMEKDKSLPLQNSARECTTLCSLSP